MFFDTHAHYSETDGDFAGWVQRARTARVPHILLCSSGRENTFLSRRCAESMDGIFYAAGLHPEDLADLVSFDVPEYQQFLTDRKCLAVGEIGLDYYYAPETRPEQTDLLRRFLDLAHQFDKPVVIHCRDREDHGPAYEDAYRLLKPFSDAGGRIILHAFAGSPDWLKEFLPLNTVFGAGGMLTFKKADNIRRVVSQMPPDRIFLETDSPYLAPVPFRGKTNHPAMIPVIASALAALRGIPVEDVERQTTANVLRFFRMTEGDLQ